KELESCSSSTSVLWCSCGVAQADEILAQRQALLNTGKQDVTVGTELVDRFSGRCRRLALGGHPRCSLSNRGAGSVVLHLRPLRPHATHAQQNPCLDLINQR